MGSRNKKTSRVESGLVYNALRSLMLLEAEVGMCTKNCIARYVSICYLFGKGVYLWKWTVHSLEISCFDDSAN